MSLRETVQMCSTCQELTPHSRRTVPWPRVLALVFAIGAGGCFLRGASGWLGAALLGAAVLVLLRDRDRFWSTHCERCRGKRLAALRRTRPTLGSSTEINLLS